MIPGIPVVNTLEYMKFRGCLHSELGHHPHVAVCDFPPEFVGLKDPRIYFLVIRTDGQAAFVNENRTIFYLGRVSSCVNISQCIFAVRLFLHGFSKGKVEILKDIDNIGSISKSKQELIFLWNSIELPKRFKKISM